MTGQGWMGLLIVALSLGGAGHTFKPSDTVKKHKWRWLKGVFWFSLGLFGIFRIWTDPVTTAPLKSAPGPIEERKR